MTTQKPKRTHDFYFPKVLSTSGMAHLLFFAALLFTPIDTTEFSEDLFAHPNRFHTFILQAPEKVVEPFVKVRGRKKQQKARDEEGIFGKPRETRKEADPSRKGAPVVDIDKREEDRKFVKDLGILGAFEDTPDSAVSSIFGSGGLGSGINDALGGLHRGAGPGTAHGFGGLNSRGLGPGGGGNGPLGIGDLNTRRGGPGRDDYGAVDLEAGDRGKSEIKKAPFIIKGGLDKEVIARIVRRHQSEIKYCYEREMQKDPNLYGKVAIRWVIDSTGAVATATVAQTTMGNASVENCLITRVKRWRFPPPRGGGIVQVTYPWIFKPSR